MSAFGLSSGSLPRASARELIAALHGLGLSVVDLRLGKRHGWEADGLAVFTDAGVQIAFVGLSVTLGEGDALLCGLADELKSLLANFPGLPVKVFASAELDAPDSAAWELAARQLGVLAAVSGGRPLVETHHGYAGLAALDRLCSAHGCSLLLDVGGFLRLTGGFADPRAVVAAHATAAQVKGVSPADPGTHRPLSELPDAAWALLNSVPRDAPVTIESKSGTLARDVAALRAWRPASTPEGH